jgi:TonB-dependent receptor
MRGLFSQFKDDGQDWIYSPSVGSFDTPTLTNADGSSGFTHVTRKPAQRLFSTTAGARHELGNNLLTYEVAFGQARFTGFFPSARFSPLTSSVLNGGVQFSFSDNDPFTPVLRALNANIFDPTQYFLKSLSSGDDHTFERDVAGTASLAHSYKWGSHFSTLEFGAKVRDAHKSELDVVHSFRNTDQTLLMSNMLGTFTNPNYYFGVYGTYGPTTNYQKILAAFRSSPAFVNSDNANADLQRTAPGDFNVNERVAAGYIMNTVNFSRFRLQAGVRIEATSADYLANHTGVDALGNPLPITPIPGSQSYIDVLPSIQLQTRFGSDTIVRLAYGMGIARPNFSDLPPRKSEDRTDPALLAFDLGNPALKRTRAQNIDLLFEHYLKPLGVIEGGFFYKYLTDPIYAAASLQPSPDPAFLRLVTTQPINGPHAHIYGFEMAWQQRLSFLPGFLNGSGVRANYSYTTSQATFPPGAFADTSTIPFTNRSDTPLLQRQAPNNWNFDYTYDKKGLSARMGLTHNDASIFQYNFVQDSAGGLTGPQGDVYLYPHTQVDAQASYWIPRGHGLQVIGYVLNLTNETFGFYQGSQVFPIQREYYNRTYSIGLRWTLGRENH